MGIFKKLFSKEAPKESPFERRQAIVVPFIPVEAPKGRSRPNGDASLRERIEEALNDVRPYLNTDGGDIELVNVSDDGIVEMHFVGACHGCPSSAMTLKLGIEQTLKERIPEVKEVVAV